MWRGEDKIQSLVHADSRDYVVYIVTIINIIIIHEDVSPRTAWLRLPIYFYLYNFIYAVTYLMHSKRDLLLDLLPSI